MASEQRNWLKIFGLGCVIILALLIVAIVAGVFGLRAYLHHQATENMTPEEIQAMTAFFEEPVEIPSGWQIVEPFPSEVVEAGEKVRTLAAQTSNRSMEWSELLKRLQQGESLTNAEWDRLKETVEREQPLIDAIKTLARTPGYELEAFPSGESGDDLPNLLLFQNSLYLLCNQAYLQGRIDRWEEAFDSALTGLHLAVRHPASTLIAHLIGLTGENLASQCISNLALQCNDPAILQNVLLRMEALDSRINLQCLGDAGWVDMVGMLRSASRRGMPVDLASRQPKIDFLRQWMKLSGSSGSAIQETEIPILSRSIMETLYTIWIPNAEEAQVRENAAHAQFDLARLTVARRIDTLSHAEDPGKGTTVKLAGQLTDPFTDAPYLYSEARQAYYSAGPDQADQGMTVPYDPTNGTVSEGDIEL